MIGEASVAGLLLAIEAAVPPPAGQRHLFFAHRRGTPVAGYTDQLVLQVAGPKPVVIYIDEGDLRKDVDQFVSEVRATVANAARAQRLDQPEGQA